MLRIASSLLTLVILAACTSEAGPSSASVVSSPSPSVAIAPSPSVETAAPSPSVEASLLPGAVAATPWHDGESLVPVGFSADDPAHPSPERLVEAMVARIRQVGEPEPWARGVVTAVEGAAAEASIFLPLEIDDAHVGSELRLHLSQEPDGWRVATAEVRFHCRERVSLNLCG